MLVRALSVAITPALAMDTVCCSITCNEAEAISAWNIQINPCLKHIGLASWEAKGWSVLVEHYLEIIYLVQDGPRGIAHLVELVDAADAAVGQHQGATCRQIKRI